MCSLWQEMLPFRADAFSYENRNANWKTQIGNRKTFGKILPNVPNLNLCITKTCLYNFDPLKPHFCIIKLGFTGVYIIFLISAQKHRLWVLEAVLSSTHNQCFEQKYEKYQNFLSENFHFHGGKIFSIFE